MTITDEADVDTTYTLISCKGNKTVRCSSKAEAVAKAKQMECKLQPAFGVEVEDAQGKTIARIVDGEDVLER